MGNLILGCIADDFTGGTDLAGTLVNNGMRTLQVLGIPEGPIPDDIEAVVIGLKSRTAPVEEAVRESLEALRWLKEAGCVQFFFKYCSTFDSTPAGNIGPVADALQEFMETDFAVVCPAFPENERSVYKGYLFVGDVLLSESGMRHHPLTPMTDANLVRVMQTQTRHKVGLIPHEAVSAGSQVIKERMVRLQEEGIRYGVVDALSNDDLKTIGRSLKDHRLITGGSGIAIGLPGNYREAGLLKETVSASRLPVTSGLSAIISGSCSVATNDQVAEWSTTRPSFQIDPLAVAEGKDLVGAALEWAKEKVMTQPVLIYASARPESVKRAQEILGVQKAGDLVEETLSRIAVALRAIGVDKLVVAGGETSGAVVKALGITALRIGDAIDPGVPWTFGLGKQPTALALKSGNFGTVDFFEKALGIHK